MSHRRTATSISIVLMLALAVVLAMPFPVNSSTDGTFPGLEGSLRLDLPSYVYVPGEVIVKFKPGVRKMSVNAIPFMASGDATLDTIGPEDKQDTRLMKLAPDISVEEAVEELEARDDVIYAEPNYFVTADYTPTDPDFPLQWGLYNDGQVVRPDKPDGVAGTPGADIDATGAWDIEKGYTNPVTVAVIDTGVDTGHPDLKNKIDPNGYNFAGISCIKPENAVPVGEGADNLEWAQSIRGVEGVELTDVGFFLLKQGTPTQDITVMVKSNLADPDPGLASYTITPSEVGTEMNNIYKPLSATVPLTAGTEYFLVLKTANNDASNYYMAAYGPDSYAEGEMHQYDGATWVDEDEYDFSFRTNPNSNPRDDNGHGTHCAGVIGAEEGNGQGTVGVSFGARIMPVKVLSASLAGEGWWTAAGVYHAVDNGAKVLNMSLGSSEPSETEEDAINYAHSKGAIVCAATGNDGIEKVEYPAGYENAVGVGATDNKDERAPFSNYGDAVAVTAPGRGIFSTMPTYQVTCNLPSHGGDPMNYAYMSGTSMATPMASGLAALVFAVNPTYTPDQVAANLESCADDLGQPGWDPEFGYGRINAYQSVLPSVSPTWYLAEGSTGEGFDTFILMQNPGDVPAPTALAFATEDGIADGPLLEIPPESRVTLRLSEYMPDTWGISTLVAAEVPIVVERSMYWNSEQTAYPYEMMSGHANLGLPAPTSEGFRMDASEERTTSQYFPEGSTAGFDTWILLFNPMEEEAKAKVTLMDETGPVVEENVTVGPLSRKTVHLNKLLPNANQVATSVESDTYLVAERSMYWDPDASEKQPYEMIGGHATSGSPVAAKGWYVAEGSTGGGFETFVLLQNPSATEAPITITFADDKGVANQATTTMPAGSRSTFKVSDYVPGNFQVSASVDSDVPVVVERSMYWNKEETTEPSSMKDGHSTVGETGAASTWVVSEGSTGGGFDTFVLITNTENTQATASVTFMTENGPQTPFNIIIPPNSRYTLRISDHLPNTFQVSTLIQSDKDLVVERSMYWDNRVTSSEGNFPARPYECIGGHSANGMDP